MDCIFCKIVSKEISSSIVYEDDDVLAFDDINPQAPVHIIIIPKRHIERISDLTDADDKLVGKLVIVARNIAHDKQIEEGYRLVFNNNPGAGQSVFHIHLHLLGGRQFSWPPG